MQVELILFRIVIVGSKTFTTVPFKVTTVPNGSYKRQLSEGGKKGLIQDNETNYKFLSRYNRIKINSKSEIICRKNVLDYLKLFNNLTEPQLAMYVT